MKNAGRRPPLQSSRLLDQVRERIRYRHSSLLTGQCYVYWYTHVLKGASAGVPSPLDSLGSSLGPLHCAEQMSDSLCMPWIHRWTTAAPVAVYR